MCGELTGCVVRALKGKFEGSVPWYTEAVKLDLEARKVIERVRVGKRLMFRLRKSPR